jgi:hypothetical protein
MRWFERRSKKDYTLDWKAGVVGPLALFLILLIPILGWAVGAILFLIAVGALVGELLFFMSNQKLENKIAKKK